MAAQSCTRAWLALTMVDGIGAKGAVELVRRAGSPQRVMAATQAELCALGLRADLASAIASFSKWREVDLELARVRESRGRFICLDDAAYPKCLREITDPPPWLVMRGGCSLEGPAVAVVGARRASPYGIRVASELARGLAHAGVTVVSGLALGIDGAAHEGALTAGGKTIAVLGSGIGTIYPSRHRDLAERVCQAGVLVSELSVRAPPRPLNFPSRNRIIAGLSMGVVVVEAGRRSGALLTAEFALEQGREVFAVPGRIDSPLSWGTNRLIREGATLVGCTDDVLVELALGAGSRLAESELADRAKPGEGPLGLFCAGPLSLEEFMEASGLGRSRALAELLELELKGCLRRLPGGRFERKT